MTAKAMAKNVAEEKDVESLEFTTCFCGFGKGAGSLKDAEVDLSDSRPICRICLSEDGTLVQPCACSGSIGFVHRECLNRWLTLDKKGKVREECELCKRKFSAEGLICLSFARWTPPRMSCKVLMVVCGILGLSFSLLYIALLLGDRDFYERVLMRQEALEIEDIAYLLLAGLLIAGVVFLSVIGVHGTIVYFRKQRIPKFVDNPLRVV